MALSTHFLFHALNPSRSFIARMREVAPTMVLACFAADAAVSILSLLNYMICARLGVEPIQFFRLGQEYNLPTWYSSFQHALVALLLGALAIREISVDIRRFAICLPSLMFLFFSLDETGMIHERIGSVIAFHSNLNEHHGLATGPAMIACFPVALMGVVFMLLMTRRYWQGRSRISFKFILGLAVFFLCAGGLELLSNTFSNHVSLIKLETFIEETGEMVGTTIVLWASLELLAAEKLGIHFDSTGIHFD